MKLTRRQMGVMLLSALGSLLLAIEYLSEPGLFNQLRRSPRQNATGYGIGPYGLGGFGN